MSDAARSLPRELPPGECLLSLHDVQARVRKSTRTILRWTSKGIFPPKYRVGPNSVMWRQSEVEAFIAKQTQTPA